MRERLLRETILKLAKTDEICRASESMLAHMRIIGGTTGPEVNRMTDQERSTSVPRRNNNSCRRPAQKGQGHGGKECGSCGYQHPANRESCPAKGKDCLNCGMKNHFAAVCRHKQVKATEEAEDEESDEVYQTEEILAIKLHDSQLVTLKLESGSFIPFHQTRGLNVMSYHCTSTKRHPKTGSWRR